MKTRVCIITIGTSLALMAPAAHATGKLYLRSGKNHAPATTKATKNITDPIEATQYPVFRDAWGLAAI
jgi:hypothetical protein